MIRQNPYHKVGGRPPLTKVKDRIFELVKSETEKVKGENLPVVVFRPSDLRALYKNQYGEGVSLNTIKKYLLVLCDEGKLKNTKVYDNKKPSGRKRRSRHLYEYNLA